MRVPPRQAAFIGTETLALRAGRVGEGTAAKIAGLASGLLFKISAAAVRFYSIY